MTPPRTVGGRTLLAPANIPEPGAWWRLDGEDDAQPLWARVSDEGRVENEDQAVTVAADRLKHLDHPAIPRVLSVDPVEGTMVVVAPDGVPLARLLEHRAEEAFRMTPATLLDLGGRLAEVVVHAHERGRPHGHLSPDCVWITADGDLVVWGYAGGPDATGSPRWWAPERARGRRASGDADQWAVGAILAALVTGRVPWRSEDPVGDARIGDASHLSQPVMDQWKPLGRLVERALATEPRDRFPSVHPIRQAIDAMRQRVPQPSELARMGAALVERYGEGPRHAFVEDPPTFDTEPTHDDLAPPTTISATPPPLDAPDPFLRTHLRPRVDFDPPTDIGTSPTRVPLYDTFSERESVVEDAPRPVAPADDVGPYTVPPSALDALDDVEEVDDLGGEDWPPLEADAPPSLPRADDVPSVGDVAVAQRPPPAWTPPEPTARLWYERVDVARIAPWAVGTLGVLLVVYVGWLLT